MLLDKFYSRLPKLEKEMEKVIPRDSKPKEVYGLIWEFLDLGGKRFRPMLCMSSSVCVGGKDDDSLSAAAAIELFHNFTLVHDDIEDDSQLRRGKKCLHIKYGLPLAINSGDGLFMMVWKSALTIKSKNSIRAQKMLLNAFSAVLEGQGMELAWYANNNWDIKNEDYLKMAGGKTAALVRASSEVGALLGGGSDEQIINLALFGEKLGLAFQIQDDLLNLTGDVKKYKKEIGGDIREGKRTLMVIDALKKLNKSDTLKMKKLLGISTITNSEINWCIDKLKDAGSIDYTQKFAQTLIDDALENLNQIPNSKERDVLVDVANYILKREE